MRIILILLFSVSTIAVEARMYQWVEPGVETTQLSGKPPAWYRSAIGGPRTFVFDKGRLIDDTAVEVSNEIRQRMREQAFLIGEEDQQKAKERIARSNELKHKLKKEEIAIDSEPSADNEKDEKKPAVELLTDALLPKEEEEVVQEEDGFTDKSVDELRAMISEWEKSQTESAKQALE